jgi:hypothetical protein
MDILRGFDGISLRLTFAMAVITLRRIGSARSALNMVWAVSMAIIVIILIILVVVLFTGRFAPTVTSRATWWSFPFIRLASFEIAGIYGNFPRVDISRSTGMKCGGGNAYWRFSTVRYLRRIFWSFRGGMERCLNDDCAVFIATHPIPRPSKLIIFPTAGNRIAIWSANRRLRHPP